MAKQLNVSLGFQADTSQAKAQIQDLQNQLSSLISTASKNPQFGVSKELQQATTTAAALKLKIDECVNANTGKLDLGKFTQSLKSSNLDVEKLKVSLEAMGPSGTQAFSALARSITLAETPMRSLSAKLTELGTTLKNTARWQISSSILHGFMGTVQSAYGYAQDLNASLNDIRIVTGANAEQMETFAANANKAAKALSTTTVEYTKAALIYYQQGDSDSTVLEKADVTTKMANVTGQSADVVSDQLTAIWNNFNKSGDVAYEHYADVLTALGAKTASSTDEIAGGLEKFASIADMIGLSYEYAASALATITATTRQSEDVVGTALKTIFARIQGLNLGETLDDGTTLNKYSEALMKVGISIKDQNGELKDMDSILNEMGAKWSTLSKDQQVALAQTVAGVRQYNQLVSLMDNWDFMQENLDTSYNSDGELDKQAEIYAESWEAARDRATAAAEEIYNQLLDDDFFITLTNGFAEVLESVSDIIDAFGGLKGVLITVGTVLITLFKNQAAEALSNLNYNLQRAMALGKDAAAEQTRSNAQSALKNMAMSNAEMTGEMMGGAYGDQAVAQEEYLSRAREMTEEQRKIAEFLLQQHQALVDNTVAQGQAAEQAKAQADISARNAMDKAKATGDDEIVQWTQEYQSAAKQAEAFGQVAEKSFASIAGAVVKDQKQVEALQKNFKALNKVIGSSEGMVEAFGDTGAKAFKDLGKALESGDLDEIDKQISAIMKTAEDMRADAGEQESLLLGETITEKDVTNIQNAGKEFGKLTNAAIQTSVATDGFSASLDQIPSRVNSGVTSLINFAQKASAVAMAVSSLKGLFDTWNNEDMSIGDKLIATFTTLGMVIPMVTTVLSGNTMAQIANTIAIKAANIAGLETTVNKAGEVIAIKAATVAKKGETKSVWANVAAKIAELAVSTPLLVVTLAIIAAIAALVAIVLIVVAAFKAWQNASPEGQLKALEERAQKSEEAFQRVADAVNETREAIKQLQSAYTTIENLTKGTAEWYKAVSDVNYEVTQLLEKYPELSNHVYQEDGMLKIAQSGYDYIDQVETERLNTANNIKLNDAKAVNDQKIQNAWYDSSFYDEKAWKAANAYYQDDRVGENMFTRSGAEELVNALYGSKEDYRQQYQDYYGTDEYNDYADAEWESMVDNMEYMLEDNRELIQEVSNLTDQNRRLDDAQLEAKLASVGSVRTAEQGRELLGEEGYSGILASSREKVEKDFDNDWNDHINYSEDDEQWADIQKFMQLKGGDDTKYVAQRWGKMVLEIDGEEVEFTKDEFYDALAEMASTDELKTRMQEELQTTLGDSLKNTKIDLSAMSADALIGLDNLHIKMEESLSAIGMGDQTDSIFSKIVGEQGDTAQLEQFANTINNIDWSSTERVREFNAAVNDLNTGKTTVDEFTTAMEKLSAASQMDGMGAFFQQAAEGLGLGEEDAKVMHEYAKNLMEAADGSNELSEELQTNADSAADLAVEITRMNKGVDKLADGFEDWSDVIENSSETSLEYSEAMAGMKDALADVLDVESDLVSNDFVVDHMEDIEKAATGDADAIDRLRAAMDEEIITNITLGQSEEFIAKVNELDAKVHELADNAPVVEVGAILDDADFLAAANNLVSEAGMTADEANAYFAGIGYEPVYSTEDIDNSAEVPNSLTRTSVAKIDWESADVDLGLFGTHSIKLPAVTTKTESVAQSPTEADGTMRLTSFSGDGKPPQIKGMRKKATGSQNNYSSSNKGGGSPGSSGGNKGGGSTPKAKEKFKIDKDQLKNLDEEKERYHEISNALESVGYELDEIADKKDRAFGKDKLKAMEEEEAALKKQIKLQQQYKKEIADNQKKDKKKVQDKYGAKINKDGDITNYDEMVESQTNTYNDAYKKYIDEKNAAVAAYNSSSRDDAASEAYDKAIEAADEKWQAAQDAYQDFQDDIAQYEETVDLFKESEASLREMENQLYDLQLEKIDYKVNLQIDFSDDELEHLEYLLERIEEKGFSAAEAIANLGQQTQAVFNKSDAYKGGIMEIFGQHGLTEDDMNAWLAGDEAATKKVAGLNLTENEVEKLREYTAGLRDNNEALIEMRQAVHDKMLETFDEWNEKIDRNIDKLDHLKSMTESYRNIVDLVGKANFAGGAETIERLNASTVKQAGNYAQANIANRDRIAEQLQATRDAYDAQKDTISEEERKMWEDTIKEMEDQLNEAEEAAMGSIEEWMEAINQQFLDSVTNTMDKFADAVAGRFANLNELSEAFERQQSVNDRYLESYEKIYEFSKLNRDIEKSIDQTDNVKAKKELADLQAEINALEESGAEVSEYQMENLRKRYELKLAELALEETQNAKSEVRMTRDNEGNWGYVYTADETQVAEAEQNYEDKLYELQQQNAEYINQLQESIITMQQEMYDKMQEIAADESLSIEERQAKMQEVQAYYQEQMGYYYSELELVLGNNKVLYEDDWQKYSDMTGYKIAKDEEYVDSFDETAYSVLTGFTTMEEAQGAFNSASETMYNENLTAMETWQTSMENGPLKAMGSSFETLASDIDRELGNIESESDTTTQEITDDCEESVEAYNGVLEAVIAWENQYSQSVDAMIGYSDNLIAKFNQILSLWADVKAAAEEAEDPPTPDDGGGDGDGGDGDGGGGDGDGGGGDGKPSWDRVVAAYNKINGGKWGNGLQNRINKGKSDGFTEAEVRAGQQLINYTYPPNLNGYGYSREKAKSLMGYDTGGYTGEWGDTSGRLALLHQKELVLNQEDTANMLSAIEMIRQISSLIDLNAMSSMKGLGGMLAAGGVGQTMSGIEQHIEIHASFPDATDHSEIEEAFHNLLNSASQYANRKL